LCYRWGGERKRRERQERNGLREKANQRLRRGERGKNILPSMKPKTRKSQFSTREPKEGKRGKNTDGSLEIRRQKKRLGLSHQKQ